MEELSRLLNKLTIEDVEKLKVLMSLSSGLRADKSTATADKLDLSNKEVVTLRVFTEEYKSIVESNGSVSYLRSVNNAFNYLLEFFGPHKPINNISLKDAESFLIFLQKNVKKGYTVYYRNLKAAFNKALGWDYVRENYFKKIKLPRMQKLVPVFINSNELALIIKQIKIDVIREVVTVGFYTGMRLNEIVNMKWKNVNLNTRIITVGDEEFTTKGRKQRFIPICDETLEIFSRRRKQGLRNHSSSHCYAEQGSKNESTNAVIYNLFKDSSSSYVFCKGNGEKFTGDYFSKRFKRACIAAGMDKSVHFHSLRHSFASNLAQQGVSLYVIKELLGHSSVSTTEIYSHLNLETLKEAISVLDGPQEKQAEVSVSKTPGLRLIDSEKKWSEI